MKNISFKEFENFKDEERKEDKKPFKNQSIDKNKRFQDYDRRREKEIKEMYENLPPLTKEQEGVVDLISKGKSVFLTGSPGCGKSVTLKAVVKWLRNFDTQGNKYYLCAPTGVSAYLIGGVTLHKAFCLPIDSEISFQDAYESVFPMTKYGWSKLQFLIIDEISMVHGRILSMVDYFLKMAKRNDKSFGGVTLLFVGDFFQLPPVPLKHEKEQDVFFAFETEAWKQANFQNINLTKCFRQKESAFVDMVSRLRYGQHTDEDVEILKRKANSDFTDNNFTSTHLFTHRYMVEKMNDFMLDNIDKPSYLFSAFDYLKEEYFLDELEQICPSPKDLFLKEGAMIMVTKNIYNLYGELILTNGTKGQVLELGKGLVETIEHLPPAEYLYALCRFENGIDYKFFERHCEWGVVRKKEVKAIRQQIPLMLAWAVTIHKSQGQTLSKGVISIDSSFASGQAMVAVSRFRKLEDFEILGKVSEENFKVNPKVLEFYRTIS